MYCRNCGNELREGQKFCPKCGAPVKKTQNTGEEKQHEQAAEPVEEDISLTSETPQKRSHTRIIVAAIAAVAVIAVIIIIAVTQGVGTSHSVLMKQEYTTYYPREEKNVLGSSYSSYDILHITFYDTLKDAPQDSWDVSEAHDGSVLAWVETRVVQGQDKYDLYIAGKGGVYANPDSSGLFSAYTHVQSINFNNCFYTDDVVNMSDMFNYCESLTSLDASGWNTSSVTNMYNMFNECTLLQSVDVSDWDTSSVKYMIGMFNCCVSLQSVDVSGWDTSNVTDMSDFFDACRSLTSLDVSNWDTSNVTDMSGIFSGCTSLTFLDISKWDTSKAGITKQELADKYEYINIIY